MRKILLGLLGLILATTAAAQTTSAPSSGGGGVGTVTSIATGACLAGGPITGTGTITVSANLTNLAGTSKSYSSTPATDNCATYLRSNSTTAMTDTLPSAVTVGANWSITIRDTDVSATDTFSASAGSFIDQGQSSSAYVLYPGATVTFISDGTNYQVAGREQAATRMLYSIGVPFGIVGSGTMGANGAVTLTTALDHTYAALWSYFPAGYVTAAQTAGVYYMSCTTTTACTIYNNTLAAGTIPYIPASPTAFSSAAGTGTQSTSAQTIVTIPLAAYQIGTNGEYRALPYVSYPNNTDTKTWAIQIGGVSWNTHARSSASAFGDFIQLYLHNRGVENVQEDPGQSGIGANGSNFSTQLAFNFATSNNLTFLGTLGTATDWIIFHSFTLFADYAGPN